MAQQQQSRGTSGGSQARPHQVNFAAIALRGAGQVADMQLTAARVFLRTQARAAAAFGFPDCSDLFENVDERARHVFSEGTEQMLETAQRANEAVSELQRQVGRVVETQTAAAAETWQRGIEELGTQAQEGIDQLCEAARQTAEEAQQATQALAETTQRALREGGEQIRGTLQEGMSRGREMMSEATEEARRQAEQAGEATTEAVQAAGEEHQRSGRRRSA